MHPSFNGNRHTNRHTKNCCEDGDRIPVIILVAEPDKPLYLHIANSVNNDGNYYFNFNINLKTWYNIIIEHEYVNGKVRR